MSISSIITEMEGHIENAYNMLELGGADLTNVDKNIFNIEEQIKKRYFDYLNNGTDEIWNNWEKVTATNVNEATLNNTVEAPMKIDLKGNTFQQSYNGYNLQNGTAGFSKFAVANATYTTDSTSITVSSTATTRYGGLELLSIAITNGKTYTVSMKATYDTDGLPNFRLGKGNNLVGNIIGTGTATLVDNSYYNIVCTFTADSDFTLDIMLYPSYTTNTTTHTAKFYDFQIVEGATEKPFEPYVGGIPSPNLDFPQQIKNVTGNANVKIQNKNLFDGEWTGSTSTNFIQVFAGKSYIYSEQNSATAMNYRFYESTSSSNYIQSYVAGGNAYTPSQDGYIKLYKTSTTKTQCQLEQGTTATTYVEHQEQNLPLSLESKNLMSAQKIVNDSNSSSVYLTQDGLIRYVTSSIRMIIKPTVIKENTAYTFKLILKSGVTTENNIGFSAIYTDGTSESLSSDSKTNTDEFEQLFTTNSTKTLDYIRSNYTSSKEAFLKIEGSMILEGTYTVETIPNYEPYYNYELCKIDTAQDYFYKENGKWFLHKEIGSVSYNGTETFNIANVNKLRYPIRTADVSNMKKTSSSIITGILSNMFVANTSSETSSFYRNSYTFRRRGDYAQFYMFFPKDFFTATSENAILSEWGTFLTQQYNNGTPLTFYYELETPVNTEITSTTLIAQLEALLQAKSYNEQTNVSQTNDDLPFILDITALKNS